MTFAMPLGIGGGGMERDGRIKNAAMNRASAAVQRETNRPSGKRRQNATIAVMVIVPTRLESAPEVAVPNAPATGIVTRKKAVTRAPRSVGLRRRISAAVPYQISQQHALTAVFSAAKAVIPIPMCDRVRTAAGSSWY